MKISKGQLRKIIKEEKEMVNNVRKHPIVDWVIDQY